jgi:hypothetical protein
MNIEKNIKGIIYTDHQLYTILKEITDGVEPGRRQLTHVYCDGEVIVATDCRRMLLFNLPLKNKSLKGYYKPVRYKKERMLVPCQDLGEFPKFRNVVPREDTLIEKYNSSLQRTTEQELFLLMQLYAKSPLNYNFFKPIIKFDYYKIYLQKNQKQSPLVIKSEEYMYIFMPTATDGDLQQALEKINL